MKSKKYVIVILDQKDQEIKTIEVDAQGLGFKTNREASNQAKKLGISSFYVRKVRR